jgi:hypothetical protein
LARTWAAATKRRQKRPEEGEQAREREREGRFGRHSALISWRNSCVDGSVVLVAASGGVVHYNYWKWKWAVVLTTNYFTKNLST